MTFDQFTRVGVADVLRSECVFQIAGLGSALSFVSDLEVYKGELYATGSFVGPSDFIARWDGTQWLAVDGGVSFFGITLEKFEDDLIVGGGFPYGSVESIAR